ncbi:MAG: hypothetical protein KC431_09665, partial [Myxococcales bacterium]|nr:hypothetical protein [Myxococcales bacterium]
MTESLLEAWRAMTETRWRANVAWQDARDGDGEGLGAALDRQMLALVEHEQLLRRTEARREELEALDWEQVLALARLVPTQLRERVYWALADRLETAEADALAAMVERLWDVEDIDLRATGRVLAERGAIAAALGVLGRVVNPFAYLEIAEALAPRLDTDGRRALARGAWRRTAEEARFDGYGPGYATALWLQALALWPAEDEARAKLRWLEARLERLRPDELEGCQDYDDLRSLCALAWARQGDPDRLWSWCARLAPAMVLDDEVLFAALSPAQIESLREAAIEAAFVEHDEAMEHDPHAPPSATELAHLRTASPERVAAVLAQARARFVDDRHQQGQWALALLPFLAPDDARAAWWTTYETLVEGAEESDPALDGMLEDLIEAAEEIEGAAAALPALVARWPRPIEILDDEAPPSRP